MTTTSSPLDSPMNHVFVDFENVHQVDLTLIGARMVSFTLMVGAKQKKLDTELVGKLLEHSASVNMVKLSSSGKNALDFSLAYYLGRAALADPTAYFHIIAKDTGYDPLITHLRERNIKVCRHASCADLTFTWPGKALPEDPKPAKKSVAKKAVKKAAKKATRKKAAAKKAVSKKATNMNAAKKEKTLEEWVDKVNKDFRNHPKGRPSKEKTLRTKIGSIINKPADELEVQSVIDALKKANHLTFDDNRVPVYHY